ncbi:5-oxoprolinase subunit B [Rubritalea halochordaticola]|uniref:5-oxoprolinase subunit B n=2 Tax=Rubritalea halochordaticola TaxID=714537 RepID=A0ABP9V049_9BACT
MLQISKMLSLTPFGPSAWLVLHPDHSKLKALGRALEQEAPADFVDYTLGYESLLILFRAPVPEAVVRVYLDSLTLDALGDQSSTHHHIPVSYDGPDLEDTAKALKLTCEELVQLHSSALYQVRFLGFSPGFPYLDGLPERIHLPRRSSPRPRMNPGAVAIGGGHASIYSIASPGGWHWLGNTNFPIFDPQKNDESAFALKSGDTLTFIPQND